ncbi:MAG: hypothetical protein IPP77_07585 [Bacteroidetes bacterium]|nr:hypothetical protein [Bacteroidota bacterium]
MANIDKFFFENYNEKEAILVNASSEVWILKSKYFYFDDFNPTDVSPVKFREVPEIPNTIEVTLTNGVIAYVRADRAHLVGKMKFFVERNKHELWLSKVNPYQYELSLKHFEVIKAKKSLKKFNCYEVTLKDGRRAFIHKNFSHNYDQKKAILQYSNDGDLWISDEVFSGPAKMFREMFKSFKPKK